MTTSPGTGLTVRTLTDLVELVPSLLGFHPADSLVVVVVEDGHVTVTARTDLPSGGARPLVRQAEMLWSRYPRALFLAIAYTGSSRRAWRVLSTLERRRPPGLEQWSFHADGVRWYDGPDDPGTAYDAGCGVLAARAAFQGLPVLGSRAELAGLLDATVAPDAVGEALSRFGGRNLPQDDLVREALALVEAKDSDGGAPSLDEATLLCLASHDGGFRDCVMLSTTRDNAAARRDLWAAVVRQSAPGLCGQALCILALAAWVLGQGALQVVCLERLAGLDADEDWVDFLDAVNREAVPPQEWETLRDAFVCDRLARWEEP